MSEPEPLNIQFADQTPPPAPGDRGLNINFLDQPQSVYQPRVGHGLWDAAQAGMQSSATGLLANRRLPDVVLDPQHSTWAERMTSLAARTVNDLPIMGFGAAGGGAVGAVAGSEVPVIGNVIGGVVGAGAGSFALPTAIRTALMEAYSKGAVTSASDFLNRTNIVLAETGKDALIGGLSAGTGYGVKGVVAPLAEGALSAGAARAATTAAGMGAEYGTMTLAPAALDGRLPEPEDFLNAAIMVGGLHAAGAVSGKLRDVYAKTGVTPEQGAADAHADPVLKAQLVAPEGTAPLVEGQQTSPVPEAYQGVADAQAVRDAIPGVAAQVAQEFYGPTIHIPDEPEPTQINYQYLNTPSQVDGALVRLSQLTEEAIQNQRRGTVSNGETEAAAQKILCNMLGVDPNTPLRQIGEASNAAQLLAMKQLTEGAANEMGAEAQRYLALGTNASPEDTARFLSAIDRCALIQQQFLGARAEAGRALQILQNTTDHGAASARLSMIEAVMAKFGKDPAKLAEMLGDLDNPEGAARAAREMTKATTWDMVVEGWKAGLLGPVTVVKKSISDLTMLLSRIGVDVGALAIDKVTGQNQMSATEPLARIQGNYQGVKDGLVQAWAVLKNEAPADGVTENFKQAIPGLAGTIIRSPFRAIEAVTQLFSCIEQRGEAYALGARQAAAEGLEAGTHEFSDRMAELATNPSEEMIQHLEEFGKRTTYSADLGEFGRNTRKWIGTEMGDTGIAPLQVVFPFLKAPLNVFKESARLSPLAPMVGEWRADFGDGGIARNKAVAEMAIGTALTGLGLAWAASGRISGSGDPDPAKRRVAQAAGWQPYSINIGGEWYSYKMIHPVGTLLGMTADIHEMSHLMDIGEQDKVTKVAANAFAHAITEQTFLQGMSTLVKALDDPAHGGETMMQNLAASVIPATVTQTTALIDRDPYKRQINSMKDAMMARLPVLREGLMPQRDPWGEPIPNDERLGGISPITEKIPSNDPVRTEAERLAVGAQAAPHSLQMPTGHMKDLGKVELTPEQRDVFGDVSGHLAYGIMQPLVNSPGWAKLPDDFQRMAYQKAIEAGDKLGKATAISPEQRQQEIQRVIAGISQRLSVVK